MSPILTELLVSWLTILTTNQTKKTWPKKKNALTISDKLHFYQTIFAWIYRVMQIIIIIEILMSNFESCLSGQDYININIIINVISIGRFSSYNMNALRCVALTTIQINFLQIQLMKQVERFDEFAYPIRSLGNFCIIV